MDYQTNDKSAFPFVKTRLSLGHSHVLKMEKKAIENRNLNGSLQTEQKRECEKGYTQMCNCLQ